ncbi:hypothetical protein GOV09_04430 [Candidatus Woesearchaeota archaeon]|nr:hypothetical protein [Candidatus Woesearchaeota archaeon]
MIDDAELRVEKRLVDKIIKKVGTLSEEWQGNVHGFFRKYAVRELPKIFMVDEYNLVQEAADVAVEMLASNDKVLIITFNTETRDLVDNISKAGVETDDRVFVIDTMSIKQGYGTPPVKNLYCINNPTDFDEIFVYANLLMERMKGSTITAIMVAPHELMKLTDFYGMKTDYNDVGIFIQWFFDRLAERDIPLMFVYPKTGDRILAEMIKRLVDKQAE